MLDESLTAAIIVQLPLEEELGSTVGLKPHEERPDTTVQEDLHVTPLQSIRKIRDSFEKQQLILAKGNKTIVGGRLVDQTS